MWQPCCTTERRVQPSPRGSNCTTTTTTKMPVERVDSTSPPAVLRAHEEVKNQRPQKNTVPGTTLNCPR